MNEHITVVYCSNYNGCHLRYTNNRELTVECDPDPIVVQKAEDCMSDIIDYAVDMCNRDGVFGGDVDKLKEFCIATVHEHFGDDVVVTFEEDTISS